MDYSKSCQFLGTVVLFRHKLESRMGAWCSPVNTSPCHGEDRGFESLRTRQKNTFNSEGVLFCTYTFFMYYEDNL